MRFEVGAVTRLRRTLERWHVPVVPTLLQKLSMAVWTAYVPTTTEIGEGTELGYGGAGIFLHPRARIGRHCVIAPFVALAGSRGEREGAQIGDYVRIGIGAKIIGRVTIGDFAVVGANAVVTRDVPAGALVVGSPARVVRFLDDPAGEYEHDTGRSVAPADRARVPKPAPSVNPLAAVPIASEAAAVPASPSSGRVRNEVRPGSPNPFAESIDAAPVAVRSAPAAARPVPVEAQLDSLEDR